MVVTEAVVSEVSLDVFLVLRRLFVYLVDHLAEDCLLQRQSFLMLSFGRNRGLTCQGKLHARTLQYFIGACRKSKTLAIPQYGTASYTISFASTGVRPSSEPRRA